MTPFMLQVEAKLNGEACEVTPRHPAATESVPHGADRHVALRSLAEQLVCEANAVLRDHSQAISLQDITSASALGFRLTNDANWVEVNTSFADGKSLVAMNFAQGGADKSAEIIELEDLPLLILELIGPEK